MMSSTIFIKYMSVMNRQTDRPTDRKIDEELVRETG